jgi:hypothetical protein
MLRLLLIAVLLTLTQPAALAQTPADAQRVKAALAELDKAFKDAQPAERTNAIQHNAQIADAEVARSIGRGLADRDAGVQRAAITALRWMDHPEAVKQLEAAGQHESPLRKDPELFAALLKGIGQHGSASSIALLKDDVWSVPDYAVMQARILSLGRIRTPAAAEALIAMMRTGGPLKIQPLMEEFRVALAVLTGTDQGRSQEMWMHWWNENHDKLKIESKPPTLEKPLQRRWDSYWNPETHEERPHKNPATGKEGGDKGGGKQ